MLWFLYSAFFNYDGLHWFGGTSLLYSTIWDVVRYWAFPKGDEGWRTDRKRMASNLSFHVLMEGKMHGYSYLAVSWSSLLSRVGRIWLISEPEASWYCPHLHVKGFPFACGVFEACRTISTTNTLFSDSTSGVAIFGTTSTVSNPKSLISTEAKSVLAIDYLSASLIFGLLQKIPPNPAPFIKYRLYHRHNRPTSSPLFL